MSKDHYSFDNNQKSWQREDIANIERQARIDEMNKALTVAEDNQKSPFNMMECENGKDLIYGVNEAYLHHRIKELEREE